MAVQMVQRRRVPDPKLQYIATSSVAPHFGDYVASLRLMDWLGVGGGLRQPGEILNRPLRSR
jgi:hypothetical protein